MKLVTIKDLREAIKDLPDDMPVTAYYNGACYTNDIWFRTRKLWRAGKHMMFFVIDRYL